LTQNKIYKKMKRICLTFDDGLESHVWAKDLLKDNGLKGTFFISTANMWENHPAAISLGLNEPVIDLNLLPEFEEDGFEIGSHTVGHPALTNIGNNDQVLHELISMNEILTKHGVKEINTFAYPAYYADLRVANIVKAAGFTHARTGYDYGEPDWTRWDFLEKPKAPRPKIKYPEDSENNFLIKVKGIFNFIYRYEDFVEDVEAMDSDESAVFVFHGLKEKTLKEDFKKVVDFITSEDYITCINFRDI
tara:strand:+ start:9746 stop:10489 length:744 start_codon:yes stop_codon:yes gene_type:complete